MSLALILAAMVLSVSSGLPGLVLSRISPAGQRTAAVLMCAAAAAGLAGACLALVGPDAGTGGFPAMAYFPWPALGDSRIGVDPLSAFFLVPVFLMGALGSLYGLGYWPGKKNPGTARRLQLFWGLLVAGMALLVSGRHLMAFLLGWEVMALSAFFLVSLEGHRPESRRAGFIYLAATHVSTLTLFALAVLWRRVTGSFALGAVLPGTAAPGMLCALFLLVFLGFGLKAGIMPLHFWLPGAHANAPSHVSAMLSGVVLKMGIYGLVRFLPLFPDPPRVWGGFLLLAGVASGLFGVVFALGQHDLKRLLAYHSVENIGIILMGLGLALLGRSTNRPELMVLGLAGCLLHVWNHALFKPLLFFGAGSVIHASGTREIDRLGGLSKTMPRTAALFLVGAVAICGLPPLNGFVSELFIYLGLLGGATGGRVSASVLAAPVLAMTGALAVACFVKVVGTVFLGIPRTPEALRAREAPLPMRFPMLVLAACCALIGLAPALVSPALDAAISAWSGGFQGPVPPIGRLAPLGPVAALSSAFLAIVLLPAAVAAAAARRSRISGTWDCGYARPTPRMQYSGSSFAWTIVRLFRWVLKPHVSEPRVEGIFPASAGLHSHVDEVTLDRLILPASRDIEHLFGWFRRFQQGLTQNYILYIFLTAVLLLCTLLPFRDLIAVLVSG